jgi:septum site-determining protein MinD
VVRIIGIISGKGGVGKTTVALNLGAILAREFSKNVTLIDCNLTTSHLSLYLGMYYTPMTLNKVLRGDISIEEAIYEHFSGMKIIPASLSLTELEGIDVVRLKESINSLSNKNDIILLDSSPGLGRESLAVLKASKEVIYVTTPHVPPVMDIVRCQVIADELEINQLGIVLNMVKNEKYEMTPNEIEELTRLPIIARIPFDKNVERSLALKIPVVVLKPKSRASKELLRLSEALVGKSRKSSFFSRILRRLRVKRKHDYWVRERLKKS